MAPTTDAQTSTNGAEAQRNTGTELAGPAVGGVIAVLLLVLIIIIIVVLIVWSRKRNAYSVRKSSTGGHDKENPTYEEAFSVANKEGSLPPVLHINDQSGELSVLCIVMIDTASPIRYVL